MGSSIERHTMKLMYALWGETTALHDRALHHELARAGATALQVNVSDADVAAAQTRIGTYPEPVTAIVSVHCDDHTAITPLLAAAAAGLEGWIVDERTPLPPPPTPNGQRCAALANIALLRIPDGMTRADWLRYWHGTHTTIAIETQATFGYVQNTVLAPITGGPAVDGLVEELFPMAAMTDPHAFWGSAGDETELRSRLTRMLHSIAAFGADRNLDLIPTSRYTYDLN
ncbi:EthD domain-containing protein [Nocardia sp. alder85J]|uniref:EthD domain-containing protein n=1 Tax=Nocardia sp. alder85J TaxID=2862949 RepID=UPI001CD217B6|nr:EthD domain-containing protein [Nocardia sp. alder85J]MCX4098081.1 EthD domain-containing protein [Nocardia sp. alder85J]